MDKLKPAALCVLIAFATLILTPAYAKGEENHMKTIFMDTFYGMAAGALLATAISLTQDNPDWGQNVGAGAAIGGIGGALFGIASEMRYLASLRDGHVYVSAPSIRVDTERKHVGEVVYTASLFQYKF